MSANTHCSHALTQPFLRYCKRVYQPNTDTSTIFLALLKLYLRPTIKNPPNLLQPALDLISRQNHRLDPVETLQLLPPLVSAQDVRAFLQQALRSPVFDSHVVREVNKARSEQVARKLMILESRRVKVTDSRMYAFIRFLFWLTVNHMMYSRCPQCHKRLGSSVIAVHAPRCVYVEAITIRCLLSVATGVKLHTTSAERHFPRSSTCYDKFKMQIAVTLAILAPS